MRANGVPHDDQKCAIKTNKQARFYLLKVLIIIMHAGYHIIITYLSYKHVLTLDNRVQLFGQYYLMFDQVTNIVQKVTC